MTSQSRSNRIQSSQSNQVKIVKSVILLLLIIWIVRLHVVWQLFQIIIHKRQPDVLTLSKIFYDLSVSRDFFSKAQIRRFGAAGTEELSPCIVKRLTYNEVSNEESSLKRWIKYFYFGKKSGCRVNVGVCLSVILDVSRLRPGVFFPNSTPHPQEGARARARIRRRRTQVTYPT